MQLHWDIFCRVIDNFGDIGVCWRLARQLASEHGKRVRLWVDDLTSLAPLSPGIDPSRERQSQGGVEIRRWTSEFAADRVADVVIEAFACELPEPYLRAMAKVGRPPVWVNLEYLSAEAWTEGCHGMASPHPSLPLVKYFFFPGFSPSTGGLPRESALLAERDAEQARRPTGQALEISLFCYDTAPVGELLDVLAESPEPVRLHIAPGQPLHRVADRLGGDGPWQLGNLDVQPFAFLPQPDYDRLLWRCDINFVRGEDSFVRAQWAARPFVWQIYRQEDDAHLIKLQAFVERYTGGLDRAAAQAVRDLFGVWNTGGELRRPWAAFLAARAAIGAHNRRWVEGLKNQPDLTQGLVNFCAAKV